MESQRTKRVPYAAAIAIIIERKLLKLSSKLRFFAQPYAAYESIVISVSMSIQNEQISFSYVMARTNGHVPNIC